MKEMFLSKRKLIIHTLSSSASLSVLGLSDFLIKHTILRKLQENETMVTRESYQLESHFKFIHFPQSSLRSTGNQLLSLPARVFPNLEVIGKA